MHVVQDKVKELQSGLFSAYRTRIRNGAIVTVILRFPLLSSPKKFRYEDGGLV